MTGIPPRSISASSASRVVPGTSVTIARDEPASALKSVDLPAFGRPRIATRQPAESRRPGPVAGGEPVERELGRLEARGDAGVDGLTRVLREVDRGREAGGRADEVLAHRSQAPRERALEARERRPRGPGRSRVDQLAHGLGAHQVDLAGPERALGELPRPRRPRSGRHGGGDHARDDRGTAVDRDLGDVLAREGGGTGEDRDEGAVDRLPVRGAQLGESRTARRERRGERGRERAEDAARVGTGDADQRDRGAPERSRERDDRVEGRRVGERHGTKSKQ